jgi:signal transduction histidine kinase
MSDASHYVTDSGKRLEVRDICAVVEEVFHRATALAEQTGVTLTYSGHPERIYTLADEQKLERMIFNILSNAIKFTPAGGTVSAKLTRRGHRMYLSVSDSGCGIAEGQRGTVFTRYTRQPAIEDGRYGLGLGMVMIRSTAALHGGTVLVDHPQDCGTRITVSLSIRQGEATLRSPRIRVDYAGERDHGLVELSEVLPPHLYDPEIVN